MFLEKGHGKLLPVVLTGARRLAARGQKRKGRRLGGARDSRGCSGFLEGIKKTRRPDGYRVSREVSLLVAIQQS